MKRKYHDDDVDTQIQILYICHRYASVYVGLRVLVPSDAMLENDDISIKFYRRLKFEFVHALSTWNARSWSNNF